MLTPNTLLKERYRILDNIGGGGFGYVYKAIDEVFGCSVAIKETREEVGSREKLRKAFEREARLLRNLKHDSLPRVTDYFFHDQAPFLVMDFIEGEDLAALLRKRLQQQKGAFTCQELLPWADKILSALEYLHSRLEPVIHRDIKPANIKLADDGEVYLLDFGLAKGVAGQMSTVIEGQTSSSALGFTREYAPLEQLQDTATEPQSDIYAMGATLYHLLTGHLPVSAFRRDEALRRGQEEPLRPAHEVNPAIPLAVSQVISQALALRWWDRIGSAREMRAALKRACEEIAATQPGSIPQPASQTPPLDPKGHLLTLPLPQQHKPTALDNITPLPTPLAQAPAPLKTPTRPRRIWFVAGLALVLLVSLAITLRFAFPYWFTSSVTAKRDAQTTPSPENPKPPAIATPTDLKLKLSLDGHKDTVWSVAFSRVGNLAASASKDKTIILWDTTTWKPKFPPLTGHEGEVYSIAFSPDGETLASGSSDKTIRIWDTQTRELKKVLPQDKPVTRLVFSLDGNILASCNGVRDNGDKEIHLWYAHNGWKSKTLEGHEKEVIAIAFSSDGNTLASISYDNTLRLWNLTDDNQRPVLWSYNKDQTLTSLAFAADGKYLACGSRDTTIKLWYQPQTQKREEPEQLGKSNREHKDYITAIAFSPDNTTLVSASHDSTIRIWDVTSGASTLLPVNQGGTQSVQWSIAFSPDGQTLLTGGEDNKVRVWK